MLGRLRVWYTTSSMFWRMKFDVTISLRQVRKTTDEYIKKYLVVVVIRRRLISLWWSILSDTTEKVIPYSSLPVHLSPNPTPLSCLRASYGLVWSRNDRRITHHRLNVDRLHWANVVGPVTDPSMSKPRLWDWSRGWAQCNSSVMKVFFWYWLVSVHISSAKKKLKG